MTTQTAPTKQFNYLKVSNCVVLSMCVVLLLLVPFLLELWLMGIIFSVFGCKKHQYVVWWLNNLKSTQQVRTFGSLSESVVNQHYIGLDYLTQTGSWNRTKAWSGVYVQGKHKIMQYRKVSIYIGDTRNVLSVIMSVA